MARVNGQMEELIDGRMDGWLEGRKDGIHDKMDR